MKRFFTLKIQTFFFTLWTKYRGFYFDAMAFRLNFFGAVGGMNGMGFVYVVEIG